MKSEKKKRCLMTVSVVFLPVFMGIIFGPIEMFFGNYKELELVFNDFGWYFILAGIAAAAVVTTLICFLPERLYKIVITLIWGVSVAAYIQVMFANKGLEQLGANPTGYVTTVAEQWPNTFLWFAVIAAACLVVFFGRKYWKKIVCVSSLYLIAVQMVGMVSLFFTAEEECFKVPEGRMCLDASTQYTVSANENIIVMVLDCFSNEWFYEARLEDAHIADCMKDFTYYNNADCNYYGTFPSLVHLLTGNPFDITMKTNDYIEDSWTNEQTNQFFDLLKKHNYKVNIYTETETLFLGSHSLDLISDKIANISVSDKDRTVDYPLLWEVMLKASCYRYAPNVLKEFFTMRSQYYNYVVTNAGEMAYYNPDFYKGLVEKGLTAKEDANYYNFIHLNGLHEFINDENCQWDGTVSRIECMRGAFKMVEEYLNQLKGLGVYDNATIVVLADHGSQYNGQPIFFIKNKNETHDIMQETAAPIDYDAFRPTMIQTLGEDHHSFGKSIYDYSDGEWRERIFIERAYDAAYPPVKRYDEKFDAAENVWHVYRYTGDMWYLISVYQLEQYETIPMADSFY